jgi:hypothetical protein
LAFLGLGILVVGIVGVIILIASGGGDSGSVANPGTQTATASPGSTSGGSEQDEADITELARTSINSLPAGEWPALYDEFTLEFRGRCDRSVFEQAGRDSAIALGDNLALLEFKELQSLTINGERATAFIVGHYRRIEGTDYLIEAAFAKEDDRWKIAPASDTVGCSAFKR